jgi:biotin transporter BioY
MAAAIAVVYLGGWSWLTAVYHFDPRAAFISGVAPFVAADGFKVALAALVAPHAAKLVRNFAP